MCTSITLKLIEKFAFDLSIPLHFKVVEETENLLSTIFRDQTSERENAKIFCRKVQVPFADLVSGERNGRVSAHLDT